MTLKGSHRCEALSIAPLCDPFRVGEPPDFPLRYTTLSGSEFAMSSPGNTIPCISSALPLPIPVRGHIHITESARAPRSPEWTIRASNGEMTVKSGLKAPSILNMIFGLRDLDKSGVVQRSGGGLQRCIDLGYVT